MRLTLRTLLAYLDDTLEPLEIRPIGQKVAESDQAQELIARIKQVTRRRRLTTPPDSGPNQRFDANVVAEYLDNELDSEAVAELEKVCVESDVHLAEIASCHQILTLVLGQPALVPPTARERMYTLVQGREAIPSRRAVTAAPARVAADGTDGDDLPLLGLPARVRASWAKVLLPVAGVLLLVVLGAALYLALPRPDDHRVVSAPPTSRSTNSNGTGDQGKPPQPPDDGGDNRGPKPPGDTGSRPGEGGDTQGKPPRNQDNGKVKPRRPADEEDDQNNDFRIRVGHRPARLISKVPPSNERVSVGRYYSDSKTPPSILVTSRGSDWRRVANGEPIYTRDLLVSLPGYTSEVRLSSGVHLLLCGHFPDLTPPHVPQLRRLLESAVVLHDSKEVDLDLTLQRGRVYISNKKEARGEKVRVRLRFLNLVWNITLEEPGAEVGVELIRPNNRRKDVESGEEADTLVDLCVRRGKRDEVELVDDAGQHFAMQAPPGEALLMWQSWDPDPQQPQELAKPLSFWSPDFFLPTNKAEQDWVKQVNLALRELSLRMTPDRSKSPLVSLEEARTDGDSKRFIGRLLAIYAYGALDQPRVLIEALNNDAIDGGLERHAAVEALRGWMSRDPSNVQRLYDRKTRQGLLAGERFKTTEAETIFDLLYDLSEEDLRNREKLEALADYLTNDRVAIAQLAWEHLVNIGLPVLLANRIAFNPADSPDQRQAAAEAIRKLIQAGKLPPRPRQPGSDGDKEGDEPPRRPRRSE